MHRPCAAEDDGRMHRALVERMRVAEQRRAPGLPGRKSQNPFETARRTGDLERNDARHLSGQALPPPVFPAFFSRGRVASNARSLAVREPCGSLPTALMETHRAPLGSFHPAGLGSARTASHAWTRTLR